MEEDKIQDAFTIALDELFELIESLKKDAANEIMESKFSRATFIMNQIKVISNFVIRVTQVQDEWKKIRTSLSDKTDEVSIIESELVSKSLVSGYPTKNPTNILVLGSSSPASKKETYNLNYHIRGKSSWAIDYFTEVRKRILSLSTNCRETYNKMYVAYSAPAKFCEIHIQVEQLKIWLASPIEELHDPHNLCRDVRHVGHYGTGATEVKLRSAREIDHVFDLIKQSYERSRW